VSADEAKQKNIEAMGEKLGDRYSALWQQLAYIYYKWHEYIALFGTNSERVALLNKASPTFFKLIQDEMWDSILLSIARITDFHKSVGKENLTINGLIQYTEDINLSNELHQKIETAIIATKFCKDWRNRRLAHLDLDSILGHAATPLRGVTRKEVKNGLAAVAEVLNAIELHYLQSQTTYDFAATNGALALLHAIDDGLRVREEKIKGLKDGTYSMKDWKPRSL